MKQLNITTEDSIQNGKLRIGAVTYLNTLPFLHGIEQKIPASKYSLISDVPSKLPALLLQNRIDVGLLPVATLAKIPSYHIVGNYCLGAIGNVKSVLLLSDTPLDKIEAILLDTDSKTSVNLTRVLCRHFWKIDPKWSRVEMETLPALKSGEAMVAIGDKTFHIERKYRYVYDLAATWKTFTGLPFVFACWIALKLLNKDAVELLNSACEYGVQNITEGVREHPSKLLTEEAAIDYLTNNMHYLFDEEKQKALALFLSYSSDFLSE